MAKYTGVDYKSLLRQNLIKVEDLNDAFSGMYTADPSPSTDIKTSSSQLWNNFIDGCKYYFHISNAYKVATIDDAFKYLRTLSDINAFFRGMVRYKDDSVPLQGVPGDVAGDEDEFIPPKDFLRHKDQAGIYKGKIRGDCEDFSWFANYVRLIVLNMPTERIIENFNNGKVDNIMLGMYDNKTGHESTLHEVGDFFVSVDNFGRNEQYSGGNKIKARRENIKKVCQNFLEEVNYIDVSVSEIDGSDWRYVEGGEAKAFETGEGMVLKASDIARIIKQEAVKRTADGIKFVDSSLRGAGYDVDKVREYVQSSAKGGGFGARNLVKQLKFDVRRVADMEIL